MKKWEALLNDAVEFAKTYQHLQSLLWKLYWHHGSAAKGNTVSTGYHKDLQDDIGKILTRMGHNVQAQRRLRR